MLICIPSLVLYHDTPEFYMYKCAPRDEEIVFTNCCDVYTLEKARCITTMSRKFNLFTWS
jgi:hypothetical protein